jgi:hypothetical protein
MARTGHGVDAVVRAAGVAEDRLVLLQPAVERGPAEPDEPLERRRPGAQAGMLERRVLDQPPAVPGVQAAVIAGGPEGSR